MRVIVFGAAGYLGAHIAEQLLRAGHAVVAVTRPGSRHGFDVQRVTLLEGELPDMSFARDELARADAIIYSAGRTFQAGLSAEEYQRSNLEITESFFRGIPQTFQGRIVFTSSMSATGATVIPHCPGENDDRRHVREELLSPYDHAKVACERIARREASQGRKVILLNPGFMLGPGAFPETNLSTTFLVNWFLQGKSPFFVNGGHSYCDVRDVAAAHVSALTEGQTGRGYQVGGRNITIAEFYQLLSRLTGQKAPFQIHAFTARHAMRINHLATRLSRGKIPCPVPAEFARSLPLYYQGDSSDAEHDLGYSHRPLAESILDTIRDHLDRGLIGQEWDYLRHQSPNQPEPLLVFRQLAEKSPHRKFVKKHLGRAFLVCTRNQDLKRNLDRIVELSEYLPRKGQFRIPRKKLQKEIQELRLFFEYIYFSSHEFLDALT